MSYYEYNICIYYFCMIYLFAAEVTENRSNRNQLFDAYEKLCALAKATGKMVVDVPKDGNCALHAIVDQLHQWRDTMTNDDLSLSTNSKFNYDVTDLRKKAVSSLANHVELLHESFMVELIDGDPKEYLSRQSVSGTWCDERMLRAVAEILCEEIHIVHDSGYVTKLLPGHSEGHNIVIGLLCEVHYVSLRDLHCSDHTDAVDTKPSFESGTVAGCQHHQPENVCLASRKAEDQSTIIGSKPFEPTTAKVTKSTNMGSFDVGLYVGTGCLKNELSDNVKMKLLDEHWVPPQQYDMPYSIRTNKGKSEKRFLRHEHLTRCAFLKFSPSQNGLFCLPCALFGPATAGRGGQTVKKLVTEALDKYDHLFGAGGYITEHEKTDYHATSVIRASQFRAAMKMKTTVVQQVNECHKKQVEENRQRLIPIVKTILLCGRQNIALRGHRDDHQLPILNQQIATENNSSASCTNEGNFRALLMFRIDAGDIALKQHLLNTASNATYISKVTQNELINCAGDVILDTIVQRLAIQKYFAVIADETTDSGRLEQMTMVVRYCYGDTIREDFIGYINVIDLTGPGLANTILHRLQQLNIDAQYLVGLGFDGAAAMSGRFGGVQAIIRSKHPAAVYVHCANHCLNLSLTKACTVQAIRNAQGVVSEVVNFVNSSAKRVDLLKQCIDEQQDNDSQLSQKTRLHRLCETRWVERHEAIITFLELFLPLRACLNKCLELDSETSTKAQMFLHSTESSDFLVAVCVLREILALTKPLSVFLQKEGVDLVKATGSIDAVTKVLREKRLNADTAFQSVWSSAELLAKACDIQLSMPRQAAKQRNRSNVPADSAKDYYRISIYIPFIEHILQDMDTRFASHYAAVLKLSALIPKFTANYTFDDLVPALELYGCFVAEKEIVCAEFVLWQTRWKEITTTPAPATAIDARLACDADLFPNIHILLTIFATTPVTTASAERTFSTLKRLKTHLRSTMGEQRLTGLALLHIHEDIAVDVNAVIDKFAASGNRRINFAYV